jgi:hypothetical protein
MIVRAWSNAVAAIAVLLLVDGALAQDKPLDLTPAGKAILQGILEADGRPLYDRPGPSKPETFPLPMCMFPGGLCGAVRRDGTVAVHPQYDWVGTFLENRAAVRVGGLYGFVDDEGREVVKPQYRIADDYKFGFAQVDVDGKSGLIDRDGKMVIEPKYGFIRAIAPDRFAVSERRELGGMVGGEDFSNTRVAFTPSGGVSVTGLFFGYADSIATEIIDMSGQRVERPTPPWASGFDKDDMSIRWEKKESLWGLARADGSWLVEPKFQQIGLLNDGLARVALNGKFGFIDPKGNFVIEPVFDRATPFEPGVARTSAAQGDIVGAIDKAGAWAFRTNYQHIHLATVFSKDHTSEPPFGWHFKKAERWGLLDLDGRVVLDADFDQTVQRCNDGRLVAYGTKEWLYFKADGSPLQPPDGRLIDATCGGAPPYILKVGDKFGLVDGNSSPVTPIQFEALTPAGPGVKNAKSDGKWGRIGSDGRWLLEPRFDYLSAGADVFVASIDGKRGFMRSDGTWLIEPKFDAAKRRDKETAFVTVSGATGVLRLEDQSWTVPPRPGVMCDINYAIMSQSDGKRAILSRTGESWIDIGAERVGTNLDFGLVTFLKDGKWGLVDTAGRIVVEPRYDDPVYFVPRLRGIAWAKHDGKWCAIDRRGRPVASIPCATTDPMGQVAGRFECKVEP